MVEIISHVCVLVEVNDLVSPTIGGDIALVIGVSAIGLSAFVYPIPSTEGWVRGAIGDDWILKIIEDQVGGLGIPLKE